MKNISGLLLAILFIATSCSSGKKALQKGDYFSAVLKAVHRLQSSPDNQNAATVLKDGYQMAIDRAADEMDLILSNNAKFKWEEAIDLMEQVNRLAGEIGKAPAARKIIPNPKTYTSELNMALEKAADERYNAGLYHLKARTRDAARIAFNHFLRADQYVPGYRDVTAQLTLSKELATVTVILETIPLNAIKYKLSSEFFYDQIYNYLINKFPIGAFVNFYSPDDAEKAELKHPDFVVRIEFFDFSVGNTEHNEVEEIVNRKVTVPATDSTRARQVNYQAKLKTYTDKVISEGAVNMKIIDFKENKVVRNQHIPGSFVWVNNYAIYVGDREALDNNQEELTKRKALPLPPKQDLFVEFTKPIYDQLTRKLRSFFRKFE